MLVCPHCGESQTPGDAFLGVLGMRIHYRCRWCGGQWSRKEEEEEEDI